MIKSSLVAAVMLAASFVFPQVTSATAQAIFLIGKDTYMVNGSESQDVAPYIKDGHTFLPLRYVAYAVGIGDNSIYWDAVTKTVFLAKGSRIMAIPVGENSMIVGEKRVVLEVPSEIKYGRTMLPLRAVAEAFDCQVKWDGEERKVTIIP